MLTNFLEPECLSAIAVTCWHAVPAGDTAEAREFEVFADAVAHDLRQPLRTISMFTELLLRRTELDAAAQQLAQNIIDGIERTAALLDGFHAFAIRGYDEPLLPVDISQVVVDVLRDVGHAITASGATVTAEALPVAHGRADHLSRIFQNLIVNAVRYRGALPPQVHISAEAIESEWIISVRDNGPGIPAEYRERIFLPFERLHGPSIPGVGIGLSICRKLAGSMGGRILVTDSPGTGATFRFTVPAVSEGRHSQNNHKPVAPSHGARAHGG